MAFCEYCDEPVECAGEQPWAGGDRKDTYKCTNPDCHSFGGVIWVMEPCGAAKQEGVY